MAPPITIRLNDQDSVVIARSTLLPGTEIAPAILATQRIPAGHKVAGKPIAQGQPSHVHNCGTILDGTESIAERGQKIFNLFLQTASGTPTKSETFDFGAAEFAPWVLGPTM